MRSKLFQNWFLLSLAGCFVIGYTLGQPIETVNQIPMIRETIVFGVMICMATTLQTKAIRGSLRKPAATAIAIASNIFLVPIVALPTYWWLPEDLFRGMVVASLVPCTLASASVWTRRAGGDESVAIITTVVTNMACLMVIPVGLWLLLGNVLSSGSLSAGNLMMKLGVLVIVPILIGQCARQMGVAGWADQKKTVLNVIAQLGILTIVALGAARSSQMTAVGSASVWVVWSLTIGSTVAVHGIVLAIALAIAKWVGLERPQQIACGIAGSQKTLMIGLQISIDCGASVLPMLVYHAAQLVIDTVAADRWRES